MDNVSQQVEEVEALIAIYGDEWEMEDEANRKYAINIGEKDKSVRLYIKFPHNYPSSASPTFEISAPHLDLKRKQIITNLLNEVCLSNIGQIVAYQLIDKVRDFIQSDVETLEKFEGSNDTDVSESSALLDTEPESTEYANCPDIVHGDVIVDRKSSFQGHAAVVSSLVEVKLILRKLYENKKIEHATHNIYAYRINRSDGKKKIQDYDDDGESQAGGRLLHLLEIIDVENVMVVVSRWYGGVHLGPDRFRHINNAAYQALAAANLIPEKSKKK